VPVETESDTPCCGVVFEIAGAAVLLGGSGSTTPLGVVLAEDVPTEFVAVTFACRVFVTSALTGV